MKNSASLSSRRRQLRNKKKKKKKKKKGGGRIVGGQNADQGEWPWQVCIQNSSPSSTGFCNCGGVVLSPTLILSAAHCYGGDGRPWIRYREYNTQTTGDGSVVVRAQDSVTHENYCSPEGYNSGQCQHFLNNDFWLIRLSERCVSFSISYSISVSLCLASL